ncbi:galactose mutarotase [uncultured Tateyamaria sp.]|uniref:aldose epimerase family protein n=1 Tax=Tateyamaria sp. 1078 TaxID=3417464 RepID=UPI0026299BFD|nr:galactose mutarotase [uncultured Tateyamaria sp.]
MTETYTISSDRLTALFDPIGARIRALHLDGGPNLILDADAPEFVAAYGGVLVGPVANRVRDSRVQIGGHSYQMPQNEGSTCLHSGPDGVHVQRWSVTARGPEHLILSLVLEDGACGLPGGRQITAAFTVIGPTMQLSLHAVTDAATPMALAHHPYWALGGPPVLRCAAVHYLPTDAANLPTGQIAPVAGTPFDFRDGRSLPPEIDHNLCLASARRDKPEIVATLTGDKASLTIESTEPGLQVYSGAGLPDIPGTDIAPYAGCALEPQDWPDAVNTPTFPPVLITPDSPYRQITRYTLQPAT